MKLGLTSVTFRNKTVDEIISLAKMSGLDFIEWGADIHAPASNINLAVSIKEKCDTANIAISSYGSYYKAGEGENFDEVLKTANTLGAPVIRIWAGIKDSYEQDEYNKLVSNIKNACIKAELLNIKVALEYHRGTLTQTKESALKLINDVNHPNLFTYWQPNPDISMNEQLQEIKLLKNHIIACHVFNWEKNNVRKPLSQAIKTWCEYLKELQDYSPNLILEFVEDDSVTSFIRDAISLKSIAMGKNLNVAVFLCDGEHIFNVFNDTNLKRIKENFAISNLVITSKKLGEYKPILQECEYIFSTWGMPELNEEQIKLYLPKLKAIFYGAGTVQGFARPFLKNNVKIFSAWAANAVPVAEYTVAQIVLAGKGFFTCVDRYRKIGRNSATEFSDSQPGNYAIKVGLIGAGMIGKLVMEFLRNYEYEVLVYDPYVSDELLNEYGAKKASLEEIFSKCQIVSNHLPNLPTTKNMLRYEHFDAMKENATFINTGRGAQIIEDDLIKVLMKKPNLTALLDVTYPEPPTPDSPLNSLPNVFLTPHIAGSKNNEVIRMGKYIITEAENLLSARPCKYEITEKMLETIG